MKILCHYTSKETAKLIINSNCIRFGRVSESNDPIEIKDTVFSYSGDDHDTHKMVENELKTYLNSILKVICFADGEYPFEDDQYLEENPILHDLRERPPFYLPRTWALYGKNHTGVCFIFEKNIALAQIGNQLKRNYEYIQQKVEYTDFLSGDTLYNMSESHDFDENELKDLKPKKNDSKILVRKRRI